MSRRTRPTRSHWWPRTRAGRRYLVGFLAAMALAQPPIVNHIADRIEPRVLGMPWLYVWLLGAYCLMIVVLLAAYRRGV